MGVGDAIEENITDPVSDAVSSAGESIQEEALDPINDEWEEFTGEKQARRRAERMERRQQQKLERMRQQREKEKQRRKMTIMQALRDQGAPSLFDMLGSAQESL